MKSIGAVARPTPQTIVLRRGNTFSFRFYGYDSADEAGTPIVDMSTWTHEGAIHTVGDVSDVLVNFTVTMESDEVAVYSLDVADIETLEVGTYACYARFRTAADAIVKTFLVATVVVEEV